MTTTPIAPLTSIDDAHIDESGDTGRSSTRSAMNQAFDLETFAGGPDPGETDTDARNLENSPTSSDSTNDVPISQLNDRFSTLAPPDHNDRHHRRKVKFDLMRDISQTITQHRQTSHTWVYTMRTVVIVCLLVSALSVLYAVQSGQKTQFPPSNPPVGFQSSSTRSTMDIVLACLSTLLISVVNTVHPNIPLFPTHRLGFSRSLRSRQAWTVRVNLAFLWGLALFTPELTVSMAAHDLLQARADVQFVDKATHGRWTIKHAFFARMNGLRLSDGLIITSGRHLMSIPDGEQIIQKINLEELEYEITDKEKADVFAKVVSVLQISRFLVEIVARRSENLAISPLENLTTAYVLCGVTTYILLLKKPYNPREPIYLQASSEESPEGQPGAIRFNFENTNRIRSRAAQLTRMRNESLARRSQSSLHYLTIGIVAVVSTAAVAAGHLLSWNFQFSTSHAQHLYKANTIILFVLPGILAVGHIVLTSLMTLDMLRYCVEYTKRYVWIVDLLVGLVFAVYITARLTVLVLIIYAFFSLPADVYKTTQTNWLDFIPFFH